MKVLLQCRDDVFWASDGLVKGLGRVQAYSNLSRFGGGGFSLELPCWISSLLAVILEPTDPWSHRRLMLF